MIHCSTTECWGQGLWTVGCELWAVIRLGEERTKERRDKRTEEKKKKRKEEREKEKGEWKGEAIRAVRGQEAGCRKRVGRLSQTQSNSEQHRRESRESVGEAA